MFRNKAYIYILSAVCLTAIIGITIWATSGKGEESSGGNSHQLPELNRTVCCDTGSRLMDVLLDAGVFVDNPCNGNGTCGDPYGRKAV